MQKTIYIISGLVLLGSVIFGGLYINGNYNDKSQVSITTQDDVKMGKKMDTNAMMKLNTEDMGKDMTNKTAIQEEVKNTFSKTGSFNKIDPAHYASGEIVVTSDDKYYYLNFQNNFSSANGPDLFVYLSSKQEYKNIAVGGVDTGKTLSIAKLKSISGAQSYRVSKAEFEKYSDSVIIWCKDFGIQFSRAELK